jgi:hypothetical protein
MDKEINIKPKDNYEETYKKILTSFLNLIKEDLTSRSIIKQKLLLLIEDKIDNQREELSLKEIAYIYKVLAEADSNLLTPIFSSHRGITVNQATLIKEDKIPSIKTIEAQKEALEDKTIDYSKLYSKLILEDSNE